MMLSLISQVEVAEKVKNAWLIMIEYGYRTSDIYREGTSKQHVSTSELADKVIANLGQVPSEFKGSELAKGSGTINIPDYKRKVREQTLVGVDVFINWAGSNPDEIGEKLSNIPSLNLKMITNRGVKVFPDGPPETYCTDHLEMSFRVQELSSSSGQPNLCAGSLGRCYCPSFEFAQPRFRSHQDRNPL